MRRTLPLPFTVLAVLGAGFVVLPVLALVIRVPWGEARHALVGVGASTAFRISLEVSLAATAISVLVGIPLAWTLARVTFPGRSVLRAMVVLPVVLPPVVGGLGLLQALGRGGIVGRWLYSALGIQLTFTTAGAILATTFVAMPLIVLATESGLREHGPPVRAGGRGARRVALVRDAAGDAADDRAAACGGRGPHVGEGARGIRRDDHVRGQPRGAHANAAARRLPGAGDGPGRRGRCSRSSSWRSRSSCSSPSEAGSRKPAKVRGMPLDVAVTVRRGTFAVDAAFSAEDGETVALLGPNGAGKSTIVEALAGLAPLEAGHVRVDGVAIDALPPERRPIGIAFQDALLFPHLSVLENVAFPLRARGRPGRRGAGRRARDPRRSGAARSARREAGEPIGG